MTTPRPWWTITRRGAEGLRRYDDALELWRAGLYEHSATALRALADTPWAKTADERLRQQTALLQDYQALRDASANSDYSQRLFAFYGKLDPDQDAGLLNQLRPELQRHAETAKAEAERELAGAQQQWQRYQSLGGIETELRLETRASTAYKQRAELLSSALLTLRRCQALYRQLGRSGSRALGPSLRTGKPGSGVTA